MVDRILSRRVLTRNIGGFARFLDAAAVMSGHWLNYSRSETLTAVHTIWPDLAMKRVKIAELKDHLSEHLRSVERGAELEVTDRERPIARIVPIDKGKALIRMTPPRRPFSSVRQKRRLRGPV